MRFDTALDDILGSRSHVRVLRALVQLPAGWPASAREIGRRSGVSHPTASKALAFLTEQGLVRRARSAHADSFELVLEHTATQRMVDLFAWESQLSDELVAFLREEIEQRVPFSVTAAFLFGSVAMGAATTTSDIDVAILCPGEAVEAVTSAMDEVAEAVQARFGNRSSFIVADASPDDVGRAGRRGKRLWRRIVEEGIPIIRPTVRGTSG